MRVECTSHEVYLKTSGKQILNKVPRSPEKKIARTVLLSTTKN